MAIVLADTDLEREWRITRLEFTEPPPSLFQIPPGYTITVDQE